jgi:uncharacterized membrane protein
MKIFETIVEVLNWLKIVASPFLIGIVLGVIFYIYKPDLVGIIFGSLIALLGLVVGIYLATKISKEIGATEFNSKINSSPDLDYLDEKKEEKK